MEFPAITDAEWQVMRVVWSHPGAPARQIIETLEDILGWKEGTIKSLMNRLVQKRLLVQDTSKKPARYSASVSNQEANQEAFTRIINRICTTKRAQNLHDLLAKTEISQTDCQLLIDLLESKKQRAPIKIKCQCQKGQCDCKHD